MGTTVIDEPVSENIPVRRESRSRFFERVPSCSSLLLVDDGSPQVLASERKIALLVVCEALQRGYL